MKKVTVHYHNMFGREADRGTNGERSYEIEIQSNGNIEQDRETVFREMNHVDGSEEQLIAIKERSMSVGDSVTIDGRTFKCDMLGWTEITPGQAMHHYGSKATEVKEITGDDAPSQT